MIIILAAVIYILSIILNGEAGFMSMAGVLAAYYMTYSKAKAVPEQQESAHQNKRNRLIGLFVLLVIILEFFFSYYLRIHRRDLFDTGQITIGGVMLINSFVVALELGAAILYYTLMRKNAPLRTNRRAWLFCGVLLIPFILRDLFSAGYDVLILHNSYQTAECLNLSYRALVLAAITEEFLYRGVIFDELCLYCKWPLAAAIQSLLFTLVHSERWILLSETKDLSIAVNLLAVFTMGMLAAFLRRRTRSIIPGILMHFALNAGIYDLFLTMF